MIFTPFAFMAETAAPGAWTPANIAKYWWTADAGVTESGGAVSAWVDQVGGLSIDQPTGGLQPTLTTSANLNNQNVINFNGVDDYLFRDPISFSGDGYSFTNINIAYNNGGNTNASLVAQAYLGGNDGRLANFIDGGTLSFLAEGFKSFQSALLENPATSGVKVMAFEYDAVGDTRWWFNDFTSPLDTATGGNVNQDMIQTTSLLFGAYNTRVPGGVLSGYKWNGDLAEVIFVPRVLTASDITNLQTYINTKYNLSV